MSSRQAQKILTNNEQQALEHAIAATQHLEETLNKKKGETKGKIDDSKLFVVLLSNISAKLSDISGFLKKSNSNNSNNNNSQEKKSQSQSQSQLLEKLKTLENKINENTSSNNSVSSLLDGDLKTSLKELIGKIETLSNNLLNNDNTRY